MMLNAASVYDAMHLYVYGVLCLRWHVFAVSDVMCLCLWCRMFVVACVCGF